ncbi:acyl-CoA dehydrogenase family protein [Rhodococcus gannanensis]|uniref:Acyl-CoA dehydrogenase family protein n=1 Tax=Rhodococcus gannanensis TaxID=1960308 RepID=A0ABW4P693_9NOCA
MDRYELRREDYSLSADQTDLQAAYAKFFQQHSTIETVRAAEGTGFDRDLWTRLCGTGATSMALPEDVGGDGATLVDLTLVAEEFGRWLAPVPWIDHVVGSRLLARLDALGAAGAAGDVVSGARIVAVDAQFDVTVGARLVPAGAIADHVVVREGDDVVLLTFDNTPSRVDNLGKLPMAWVDPASASARTVVASGPDAVAAYLRALDEWRVLTAAALVGLVEQTMRIAAEFATTRYTYGVPISSLQAISHPLANMAITVEGGRALARKAAWFLDVEPEVRPELAGAVFVFMAEEAPRAATLAVHVQGGLGVTTEAAATAYLVRARGWALAGGDPAATAKRVAHLVASRPVDVSSVPAVAAV